MPLIGPKNVGVSLSFTEARQKRAAPPLFPVRYQSRSLRSLHELHGDHLQSLRKPLCSEFSRRVRVINGIFIICNEFINYINFTFNKYIIMLNMLHNTF